MRALELIQQHLSRSRRTLLACAALTLSAGGCGETGEEAPAQVTEQVNVAPATLEDAQVEIARADRLMAARPQDAQLRADAKVLRESMDRLSGMVARLDIAQDHTVTFYKHADGSMTVGERMPQGTPSAVTPLDPSTTSFVDIYRRLAPSAQVPQDLIDSEAAASRETIPPATEVPGQLGGGNAFAPTPGPVAADGVSVTRSALTAADGQYFRNNFCPLTGVYYFCLPNWGGGAYAYATSTHSQVWIAPYSGTGAVSLEVRTDGTLYATLAIFVGELNYYWRRGGWYSVPDHSCCFICACPTHLEVHTAQHRWDVTNAANKGFHFGGNFYNNPRALNGP